MSNGLKPESAMQASSSTSGSVINPAGSSTDWEIIRRELVKSFTSQRADEIIAGLRPVPGVTNPAKACFADQYTLEQRADLFWKAIEVINKNENIIWGDASLSALLCARKFKRDEALGIDEKLDIFRGAKVTGWFGKGKGLVDAQVDFVDWKEADFNEEVGYQIDHPGTLQSYLSADTRGKSGWLKIQCDIDWPELDCSAITSLARIEKLVLRSPEHNGEFDGNPFFVPSEVEVHFPQKFVCPPNLSEFSMALSELRLANPWQAGQWAPTALSGIPNSLVSCWLDSVKLLSALDLSPAANSLQTLELSNVQLHPSNMFLDLSMLRRLVKVRVDCTPDMPNDARLDGIKVPPSIRSAHVWLRLDQPAPRLDCSVFQTVADDETIPRSERFAKFDVSIDVYGFRWRPYHEQRDAVDRCDVDSFFELHRVQYNLRREQKPNELAIRNRRNNGNGYPDRYGDIEVELKRVD